MFEYQRIDFTSMAKGTEFHIGPKTSGARRFADKYGQQFTVRESGHNGSNPFVVVVNQFGVSVEVEKRPEGIFVNGEFFAKDWSE